MRGVRPEAVLTVFFVCTLLLGCGSAEKPASPLPSSTAEQTVEPAGSAAMGAKIPVAFHGVYEIGNGCAAALEAGGASDGAILVRADSIESGEDWCTLKSISDTSATAFMGVFDCSSEGETYERTRAIRIAQGDRVMFDDYTEPYQRCVKEAPPRPGYATAEESEKEGAPLSNADVGTSHETAPLLPVYADGIPQQFHGVFDEYLSDCSDEAPRGHLVITGDGFAENKLRCRWISTGKLSDSEWEGEVACNDATMSRRSASFWWEGAGRLAMGGSSGRFQRCPADSAAVLAATALDGVRADIAAVGIPQSVKCNVKDAYGRQVIFNKSADLRKLPASVQDPCELARDLTQTIANYAQQRLKAYCGRYSGGCKAEDREQLLHALTPRPEIYSVGSAQWGDKTDCPAYLFAVNDPGAGLEVQFRLMGDCEGHEAEIVSMVASKGGTYGDYVAGYSRYSGEMPHRVWRDGAMALFQSPAPARELSPDDKIAHEYAKELSAHWSRMDHCFDLLQQLNRYTGTGEPAEIQIKRMDVIFDGAYRAGCIRE